MTENTQDTPPEDPPAEATASRRSSSSSGRYAAYDPDRLRFVGGTHATKADARAAAKARGVAKPDVREVD